VRVLEPGEEAKHAALEAADAGAQVLAVAGGDGSLASVAGVAVERELPFVVVPTGTLNHFARDLGLDLARPLRALDAFDAGPERRVDVGRVNGRLFINNVSLGVYAKMLGDLGYRGDELRVTQTKLQAFYSDPSLRRALRITPPAEAPLEGVVAVVVSNEFVTPVHTERSAVSARMGVRAAEPLWSRKSAHGTGPIGSAAPCARSQVGFMVCARAVKPFAGQRAVESHRRTKVNDLNTELGTRTVPETGGVPVLSAAAGLLLVGSGIAAVMLMGRTS
jgi:hypothetical protein